MTQATAQKGTSLAKLPEWQDPLSKQEHPIYYKYKRLTFATAVQSANGVYWIVLEVGVGLIAVNLPVVHTLAKGEGLQTVVNQVWSVVSLRSWHSMQRSRHSHKNNSQSKEVDPSLEGDFEMQLGEALIVKPVKV